MTARKLSDAKLLQTFLLLPAIAALLAIGLVFASPSEGDSAWLLGLSATRWGLVAALALLGGLFGAAYRSVRAKKTAKKTQDWLGKVILGARSYPVIITIAALTSVVSFYLILLTLRFTDALVQARLFRLLPLTAWVFFLALQTVIILPRLRFGAVNRGDHIYSRLAKPALFALIGLVIVAMLMGFTGLGLQPDRVGWDNPGVPLMATQILVAWLVASLALAGLRFAEKQWSWQLKRGDLIAAVAIWIITLWIWQSQPIMPTHFSTAPRAPNFEFYPSSDAATVDMAAQNLLVGEGFTVISEKPLYSFFLAILHVLVGQNYANVLAAQMVLLALFPPLLYLLATKLHHRFSGFLLAGAVVLREVNTIYLSGDLRVSHSKLLMTDLPTTLAIVAFTLLAIHWVQTDKRELKWPILVGASLGALMLLRSQVVVLLPFLLLLAFWRAGGKARTSFIYRAGGKARTSFIYSGLLLVGFLLVTIPWNVRNYQYTGQFGYSQPLQARYLARQYSLTPEAGDPGFPEGTQLNQFVSLGFSRVIQFTMQHPGEVARFVSAHFLRNEVSSFLALPMRFDLTDKLVNFYNLRPYWIGAEDRLWSECCSLDTYIAETPYWGTWDGMLPQEAWLPLAVNFVVVAIGVGAAYRKVGWIALLPVGLHLLYNFSTAVARVSGWRLILPVDWVVVMFYCLGLGQVTVWAWNYLFDQKLSSNQISSQKQARALVWSKQRLPQLAVVLLMAGMILPLSEILIPARYPDAAQAHSAWEQSALAEQSGVDLETFLAQPGAHILIGRALYPRFYLAGDGEPGGESASNVQPFSRISFSIVGPVTDNIALPLVSSAPFPNAVDVVVLTCGEETYTRAVVVVFPNHEASDLLASNADPFTCSN